MTDQPSAKPSGGKPGRHRRDDDEPVLPDTTRDERDIGWGDAPGGRDDEWYRRERPPHHD
jgi:hypothetical protein